MIGLNMLTLWDDRGTLEPWIGPLRELLDDGRDPARWSPTACRSTARPTRTACSAERRNVGKVVLIP